MTMEENRNGGTIKQGNRKFWKEHKKTGEKTKVFIQIVNMYITQVSLNSILSIYKTFSSRYTSFLKYFQLISARFLIYTQGESTNDTSVGVLLSKIK